MSRQVWSYLSREILNCVGNTESGFQSYNNNNFVGNKTKGRISKRVFQENKARQIFRKTNISYPLIRTPPFCLITEDLKFNDSMSDRVSHSSHLFETGKIEKSNFWDLKTLKTLKINNWRTTIVKSIDLGIIRKLNEYSFKNVLVNIQFAINRFLDSVRRQINIVAHPAGHTTQKV